MYILLCTSAVKIILPGGWDGFKPENHNKSLVQFSGEGEGIGGEKMQKAKGEGGEGRGGEGREGPSSSLPIPLPFRLLFLSRCNAGSHLQDSM